MQAHCYRTVGTNEAGGEGGAGLGHCWCKWGRWRGRGGVSVLLVHKGGWASPSSVAVTHIPKHTLGCGMPHGTLIPRPLTIPLEGCELGMKRREACCQGWGEQLTQRGFGTQMRLHANPDTIHIGAARKDVHMHSHMQGQYFTHSQLQQTCVYTAYIPTCTCCWQLQVGRKALVSATCTVPQHHQVVAMTVCIHHTSSQPGFMSLWAQISWVPQPKLVIFDHLHVTSMVRTCSYIAQYINKKMLCMMHAPSLEPLCGVAGKKSSVMHTSLQLLLSLSGLSARWS